MPVTEARPVVSWPMAVATTFRLLFGHRVPRARDEAGAAQIAQRHTPKKAMPHYQLPGPVLAFLRAQRPTLRVGTTVQALAAPVAPQIEFAAASPPGLLTGQANSPDWITEGAGP